MISLHFLSPPAPSPRLSIDLIFSGGAPTPRLRRLARETPLDRSRRLPLGRESQRSYPTAEVTGGVREPPPPAQPTSGGRVRKYLLQKRFVAPNSLPPLVGAGPGVGAREPRLANPTGHFRRRVRAVAFSTPWEPPTSIQRCSARKLSFLGPRLCGGFRVCVSAELRAFAAFLFNRNPGKWPSAVRSRGNRHASRGLALSGGQESRPRRRLAPWRWISRSHNRNSTLNPRPESD